VIQVVTGFLAERLPRLVTVGDFGGVNAEESDAEPGLAVGDGCDGVTVADALDLGDKGARGGGIGGGRKEQEDDSCSDGVGDSESLHAQPVAGEGRL
jgi:hypothetical protein